MKISLIISIPFLFFYSCSHYEHKHEIEKIIPFEEIEWGKLNPLRGEMSPKAGMLWGDIKKNNESGFIVEFKDGFSSPSHIHNLTYKGIVISGEVHNDDPTAAKMWLPSGSFWTQPEGEAHITAARGKRNLAFLEISKGPYLVKPARDAFDNGERPINIHQRNLVWRALDEIEHVKITYLWGSPSYNELSGAMLKFDQDFNGDIYYEGDDLSKIVVIKGEVQTRGQKLGPGSYLSIRSAKLKVIKNTQLYIRGKGHLELKK